jgi:hypothetical protein
VPSKVSFDLMVRDLRASGYCPSLALSVRLFNACVLLNFWVSASGVPADN